MTGLSTVEYAAKNLIRDDLEHVLEFGVGSGGSTRKIKNIIKDSHEFHAFDSFIGLPEDWVGTSCKKGHFSQDGKIPDIDGVNFYKGWFENTIPEYKKIAKTIALLHVDCDLYSSTKLIFDELDEFIVSGTIIVFDEWHYNFSSMFGDHEQKAFYQWINKHERLNYKLIEYHDLDDPRRTIERQIVEII